jgi:hypothetical protein
MRLFLLLIFVCCISCVQKKNEQGTAKIVKEWNNKEIVFPQNTVFTIYAEDTADYKIPESEYKVVVYTDSMSCAGCTLQGAMWKDFIRYIDSATDNSVPFLFFFNPKRENDLADVLKFAELDIPVCMDINDEFNKLNKFPNDLRFKTFLLNRQNRVVIVGNPIYNQTLEDLYIKQITGKESPEISPILTEILPNQTEINVENLYMHETKEVSFQLRNTGKRPLIIYSVNISCDYITAKFDKKPIHPNDFVDLALTIKPKHTGDFAETITVKSNTKETVVLEVRGEIQ